MLQVIWSPSAKDEFADLLAYIEFNFGTNAALKMLDKTEEMLESIAQFPLAYPASEVRPDIRKAVITAQTSLLYRIVQQEIQVLHFWDNRQNSEQFPEF
jgi:plasmid stabilization system protein ParE